jgi:Rrf2 family protein
MRMSEGVEWAAHACALLAAVPAGRGLSAAALAEYHDVPPAYMAKQMQALARAGLVASVRGAGGGYRLARMADQISLWDIAAAIEGHAPAFRCSEIRRNGPCGAKPEDCRVPCEIAAAFHAAERAWRDHLASVTLAAILTSLMQTQTPEKLSRVLHWVGEQTGVNVGDS